MPEGTNAVVLAVPDERALLELAARVARAGIPHALIREPDAPWNGQATAIGFEPVVDRDALRPYLRTLPLLRDRCAWCVVLRDDCEEHGRRRSAGVG